MMGANFGFGDPKTHLAYLTKLHLLPQTVRRKIGTEIAGCYPDYVADLLLRIESLRASGLTYPQIKYKLENPASNNQPYALAFLVIGLILGYLLGVQKSPIINSSGQTIAVAIPAEITILGARTNTYQNLYKLGKIDLTSLLKN